MLLVQSRAAGAGGLGLFCSIKADDYPLLVVGTLVRYFYHPPSWAGITVDCAV